MVLVSNERPKGAIDFARCSLHNRCINMETGVKTGEKLNLRIADREQLSAKSLIYLADREGFEPSVQVLARTTV